MYVKLLTVTSIKAVKCILPLLIDSPSYNENRPKREEGTFFLPLHLTQRKYKKLTALQFTRET